MSSCSSSSNASPKLTEVSSLSQRSRLCYFIRGVRTPFLRSKTNYSGGGGGLGVLQLLLTCLRSLPAKSGIDKEKIEYVACGTAAMDPMMPDFARNASVLAGYQNSTPAHSISMSCLSSLLAVENCKNMVKYGEREAVVASGVECMSQTPVMYHPDLQRTIYECFQSPRSIGVIQLLRSIYAFASPKIFSPKIPQLTNYLSGESLGKSAEKLTTLFHVSREDQDKFALQSHQNALKAQKDKKFTDMITTLDFNDSSYDIDNGVRETSMDALASLEPRFSRSGTITAGNSSFPTDGAAACLLSSEQFCKANGLRPESIIRDSVFVACDPVHETLLGPAYAIREILKRNKLQIGDIEVFEIHEAFAGQVLAVLNALDSEAFCNEKWGPGSRVGSIDMAKVNSWGGSLALGHPLGATGIRLLSTASARLCSNHGTKPYALVTACASGGQSCAVLLERCAEN